MKPLFQVCVIGFLCGCTATSQKLDQKLIIDNKLDHWFFNDQPKYEENGYIVTKSNTGQYDTVWTTPKVTVVNAIINDLNDGQLLFDTCRCFFEMDTLEVVFGNTLYPRDNRIVLKIFQSNYTFSLISIDGQDKYVILKQSLKIKKLPEKKGDMIFADLESEFVSEVPGKNYKLKGPFKCKIE